MAIVEMIAPETDAQQVAAWNSNVGGLCNISRTFPAVPPGTAWSLVGLTLAGVVTPTTFGNTVLPAIASLDEVDSVHGDQFYGPFGGANEAQPESIPSGNELVLRVQSVLSNTISGIDRTETQRRSMNPPLGTKWALVVLRLPAALDATKLTALETALSNVAGVGTGYHRLDGFTSVRQSGNATLKVSAHLRIEPVPE